MPVYLGIRELGRQSHNPLPTTHLTPGRFAQWIDLRTVSDGLDAAALDELKGKAIQTQALASTAIAEGLHRNCFLIPRAQDECPQSARESASKPEQLAHMNDWTFRSRMRDLVNVAEHATPGIADSVKAGGCCCACPKHFGAQGHSGAK